MRERNPLGSGEDNKVDLKTEEIERLLREEYQPFPGHSQKYRGKHRSHTKGAGIMAFFRNNWMKRSNK